MFNVDSTSLTYVHYHVKFKDEEELDDDDEMRERCWKIEQEDKRLILEQEEKKDTYEANETLLYA